MRGFRPQRAEPATEQSTAARVHAELRRRIIHGELPAGTALSENGLAAEFEVSRTPVREVLRELITEGLLEVGARRQNIVTDCPRERAREIALMLGALGELVAQEAPQVLGAGDSDELHLILIRAEREIAAGRSHDALDSFDHFRIRLAELAGLPIVADTMRRLCAHVRLAQDGSALNRDRQQGQVTLLRELADALDSGDREAARSRMRSVTSASGPHAGDQEECGAGESD